MASRIESRWASGRSSAVLIGAALALFAGAAEAKPAVPELLQEIVGMPCAPPCTICHTTSSGGRGTARKPFAQDMNTFVDASNLRQGLTDAVGYLTTSQRHSDLDTIPDIVELQEGTDPNNPTPGAGICGPEFGCVRVARGGVDGVASLAAGLAFVFGMALLRRTRARR